MYYFPRNLSYGLSYSLKQHYLSFFQESKTVVLVFPLICLCFKKLLFLHGIMTQLQLKTTFMPEKWEGFFSF